MVSYHRRWHTWHGRMCARMRLRERTGPDGRVGQLPSQQRMFLGAPAFLWRELAAAVAGWLASLPRRDRSWRLEHEMRVRHLLGYILEQPRVREQARANSTSTTGVAIPYR